MNDLSEASAVIDDLRRILADIKNEPAWKSEIGSARQYLNWAITAIQRAEQQ